MKLQGTILRFIIWLNLTYYSFLQWRLSIVGPFIMRMNEHGISTTCSLLFNIIFRCYDHCIGIDNKAVLETRPYINIAPAQFS